MLNILCMPVIALDLDTSVDDEIRRNYDPNKLEKDVLPPLPLLPEILKHESPQAKTITTGKKEAAVPVTQQSSTSKVSQPSNKSKILTPSLAQKNYATLKKGTKFRVKLYTNISDRSPMGAGLTFVNIYPVTTTYFTVPTGAQFKGRVIDSHTPQFAGNGGLIVIQVDKLLLKSGSQNISAYVTKANHKKIFLNNIKGKHTYMKGIANSVKPGSRFFNKMMTLTVSLAKDGVSIILTPFSLASGVLVFGFNAVMSPVFAIFSKGGSISIPAGSDFEIKLLDDCIIEY